jgi:thymidylate synthase
MFISESTLDDILRQVFKEVAAKGELVISSRGENKELRGVLLKLTNPRARLSHSEKRGVMFSPLGELAWYLSGSNSADFITYYISSYNDDAEDDRTIHGAYGPRLFADEWNNQFAKVVELLRQKRNTRRAVIQIFDSTDHLGKPKEVPCTCSLQFLIRDEKLDLVVSMRSNDAFKGLPHDVFCFTMIQEVMARTVDCELGQYIHFAGSLHLYVKDVDAVQHYLDEGWQATERAAMPAMPQGDPGKLIETWLKAEAAIRLGESPNEFTNGIPDYWHDLARLLQIFRYSRDGDVLAVTRLKNEMRSEVYREYITKRETRK